MCIKYTGILDGKKAIKRECSRTFKGLDGSCSPTLGFAIDGRPVTNANACVCTKDRCNGATSLQFTYLPLLVVLVHVIYKLVSSE